jgi:hypothetical protein
MGLPQLFIEDIVDAAGIFRNGGSHVPLGAQVPVEQQLDFRCQHCRNVNPVGNVGDGRLVVGSGRPDVGPHVPGHPAVKLAYPVDILGGAQSQNKHGEGGLRCGPVRLSQGHQLVDTHVETRLKRLLGRV